MSPVSLVKKKWTYIILPHGVDKWEDDDEADGKKCIGSHSAICRRGVTRSANEIHPDYDQS